MSRNKCHNITVLCFETAGNIKDGKGVLHACNNVTYVQNFEMFNANEHRKNEQKHARENTAVISIRRARGFIVVKILLLP